MIELNSFIDQCKRQTYDSLDNHSRDTSLLEFSSFIEMRYEGQGFDILIPFNSSDSVETLKQNFLNRYLEIYNGQADSFDLSTLALAITVDSPEQIGNHELWVNFPSGSQIASRDVYIISHSGASSEILNKSSQFICVDEVCLGRY